VNSCSDDSKRAWIRFFDFIAKPPILGLVHSLKADAMRVSGDAIAEHLPDRSRILDLGCHAGYLTTWYARLLPSASVLGVDRSRPAIETARQFAEQLGVSNVAFLRGPSTNPTAGRTTSARASAT
jgi:methylase of polypeptide subunit release factors